MSWTPKKTVVVPVDVSDESFAAVVEARKLVSDPSDLHLIHVLPPLSPTDPAVVWDVRTEGTAIQRAEQAIRERLERCHAGVKVTVAVGNPGAEIAAFAEKIGAELIVLPSHGRTGLRHLLIGSVAERVVRLAHCPVLVLRDGGAS